MKNSFFILVVSFLYFTVRNLEYRYSNIFGTISGQKILLCQNKFLLARNWLFAILACTNKSYIREHTIMY